MALGCVAAPISAEQPKTTPVARIPIAKLAALASLRQPILSPDGQSIAARAVADNKTTLLVLDADHPGVVRRSIWLGTVTMTDLTWAGKKRLLLQIQSKQRLSTGDEIPFLRLIAADVDTGLMRVVDPKSRGLYAGDVLYTDPNGDWALVASQDDAFSYPSVKRVDLATGKATVVEKERDGVWDWYADDKGTVRAGIAYDGSHWTVWYRDKPEEKLHAVHGNFPKDDSTVDRFIFRGDKSWIITNERTGRFGLYKYDVKSQTVGDPLFENADVDLNEVYYDGITGDVDAVDYEDDRSHVFWLDPDMKKLQAAIDRALPDSVNITVDWSHDDKRALVWSASASDPGRYFLLDRATSHMSPVIEPYPDIDPAQLAPVKPIRYQARDGLSLRGYLTLPRGHEAKNLPLILFPHGGPFARDDWEYDPFVQFFANRGYAVLQPEFRGSTGYGKDFVAKGYGEIGKKMQDDLDDGVDWLVKSGQVDPKRVCIVGWSYGGYAALWGAIRNPGRYRCAASWAGPTDMVALLHYDRGQFSAKRYFREWRDKFSSDADLREVSPLNFAGQLKVPVLIGQGEQDDNVPPKQGHQMVDALTKAGANVTSVFYKDSDHDFGSSKDLQDWLTHLETFLAKYNPS